MSVYQRMLGSGLPCNLVELLDIQPLPLAGCADDALAAVADHAYPDVLYKLGLSHLGRQELGLARKRLADAVAVKPAFVRARLALAAVCDLLALHADAIEQIDAVLATMPAAAQEAALTPRPAAGISRYALLCAAGFCLERTGNWQAAAARYLEAVQHNPADLFAEYRLAAIYLVHNDLDKAAQHHRAILEQQPQEQPVRIGLAHIYQLLGRHQEAIWEYEKACCLEPDNWELQVELAGEMASMGQSDEAIDQLKELVARQPQFPDLRLRLANLYSDAGHDEAAVTEYGRALSLHPDYLDCHIALARHELRNGRMRQAGEHFQQAIGINDQNVEAYVGLAVALHRLGQEERSRQTLTSAANIANNTDVLLAQLGAMELANAGASKSNTLDAAEIPGEVGGAGVGSEAEAGSTPSPQQHDTQAVGEQARRYRTLLKSHPDWTDVRVRLGMLLKVLGQTGEAITELEQCARENPGYVEAWVQLGLARHAGGDWPGAMVALQTALQLGPGWADLHYRLGLIYCNQLEFDLAMERLETAASAQHKSADTARPVWVALAGLQLRGRRRADVPARAMVTVER